MEDTSQKIGNWQGEVKKVFFLQKPGFCTVRTPPRSKEGQVDFPDLAGTEGLEVTLREARADGVKKFGLRIRTSSMTEEETSYDANFDVGEQFDAHFVKWTDFKCTWRGEDSEKCVTGGLAAELDAVASIGLGTYYPLDPSSGPWPFSVQMVSFVARSSAESRKDVALAVPSLKDGLELALKTTRATDITIFT